MTNPTYTTRALLEALSHFFYIKAFLQDSRKWGPDSRGKKEETNRIPPRITNAPISSTAHDKCCYGCCGCTLCSGVSSSTLLFYFHFNEDDDNHVPSSSFPFLVVCSKSNTATTKERISLYSRKLIFRDLAQPNKAAADTTYIIQQREQQQHLNEMHNFVLARDWRSFVF